MSEERQPPPPDVGDLEIFEQQLRDLKPRDAAFQFSAIEAQRSPLAATPTLPSSSSRNQRHWLATLAVTWSLGAAAGVAGTLLYSRLDTASPPADAVVLSDTPASSIHSSAQTDIVPEPPSVPQSAANDLESSQDGASPTPLAMPTGHSSLVSGWFTPWSLPPQSNSWAWQERQTLTPRNFPTELAFENPSRDRFTKHGAPSRSSEAPGAVFTSPVEKLDQPQPPNQRELLRNLLQI